MKVEIWSDVMCPFCYIGKRRFEEALQAFPAREDIQVEWKSFQLDPSLRKTTGKSINEYLAERKGMTVDQARQLNDHVTRMAAEVGLHYDFDKAVVAPSFDAHRFSHLASAHGLGDAAEEALFKAYFTEGKDISDRETLVQLGQHIGLDAGEVRAALDSDAFATDVRRDIAEAAELGARGVPFFVLDRKYAVSGAQPTETFTGALTQAYAEWAQQKPLQDIAGGEVCVPGGDC
ncbi:DsbA family oxidoreductase [Dinghuibacter silviterrae]|uniref:Putative DsbA family dithiol-disulfide isomerase n=1 Tax=Dinghuibacter silviterrae TaxID=1539049 RepID=A0A4R8DFP4_9BACT|nr:DsbA family oxidoreductase [Dinghuibacter silviterrae]TDW96064.1 putative DsbA family dithiol-disulfide isomerase [Dinghuibacter silviterrae]